MQQIDRDILRLALPSIVSNITVPLLGLIDLTIVGHMGGERFIGAIAVGSMIFNVIYWLLGFLRMGTSGMTAQALVRGDGALVVALLRPALRVALGMGVALVVLQWPLRWVALTLMGASAETAVLVKIYFNILIYGAPAMLGLYALTGWMVGMQNTRVPMAVAIVQNVVNIVASLVLVYGFRLQIEGVATGTLVAQWSGFALACWRAHRMARAVAPSGDKSGGGKVSTAGFFAVNRDIFFRTLCLVAVNLFFTSAGARQGDMMLAVNTLLMTFFTLFSYFMDGFAFAGEALSGRLYGAGEHAALLDTVRRLFRWGGAVVAVFTTIYIIGGDGILSLITDCDEVVQAARPYFFWVCLVPVVGVAAFVYDGVFIGLTATRGMLLSSVVATVVFFALFLSARRVIDPNHALWCAFLVYLAMRGMMQWRIMKGLIKF